MRINLVTPFAEKDAAKALGARWDGAKRVWYIVDVEDLTPFMRWIPNHDAAIERGALASTNTQTGTVKVKRPVLSEHALKVPHCGCTVLPWDDCEHSLVKQR